MLDVGIFQNRICRYAYAIALNSPNPYAYVLRNQIGCFSERQRCPVDRDRRCRSCSVRRGERPCPWRPGNCSRCDRFCSLSMTRTRSAASTIQLSNWRARCFGNVEAAFACMSVRACGSAGCPTSAPSPAERTVHAGSACFSMASAIGLRQILPIHTTRISFIISGH